MNMKFVSICIVCLSLLMLFHGCIDETNQQNIDDETSANDSTNEYESDFVGTWIIPDTYSKNYFLETYHADGSYEFKSYSSNDFSARGTWSVINETRFRIDREEVRNGETETNTLILEYYFLSDDNLIYGNPDDKSPGNGFQLYRLDGSIVIPFIFEVNTTRILNGEKVNLSWFIIGGDTFSINNNIGQVDRKGYRILSPQKTTDYNITINDGGDVYSYNVTVIVDPSEEETEVDYPIALMETTKGLIKIALYDDKAPITVENFINLVNDGFYDGMIFHRIMDDFMIQAGNTFPDGTTKTSPYGSIPEFEDGVSHVDGAISMASTGAGVPGSAQFFICDGAQSFLDGSYAAFGVVISGIDVVRDIADEDHDGSLEPAPGGGRPLEDIVIVSITIEE